MEEKEYTYRFMTETTPTRDLMKEAYWGNLLHSWQCVAYGVLAVASLGLAGKFIYDAWYWSGQGWTEAWGDYLRFCLLCLGWFMPRCF